MNNKSIIKNYEQLCTTLKTDTSEETKQRYLILFKELDLQLTKEFEMRLEKMGTTASNLREEIKRIENILSLIKYRSEFRTRMVEDYTKFLGYKPVDLDELTPLDDEADYVAYKTNLIVANEIILDLIKSGKKVGSLKNQLNKRGKNKAEIQKNIDAIQTERGEKLEALRANEAVLNDLYDYCLTAPFNEENAYIQYIMIKINPKGVLKINLNRTPTRTVKKHEMAADNKPLEEMPIVPSLGSVRPNNMLKYMEDTITEFEDLNVPTNGLIDNTTEIKIDSKDIEK